MPERHRSGPRKVDDRGRFSTETGRTTEAKYFTADFFGFLKDLSKNNNREWFMKNKPRYEASVQEPAIRFIGDAGAKLKALSPHLVADARPFGGSLSRIYRDIRFSADKSPYKTEVGIHFWHGKAKGPEHMSPGLYLHLGLDGNFAGGGVWHPDAPILKKIRDQISRSRTSGRRSGGRWRLRGIL